LRSVHGEGWVCRRKAGFHVRTAVFTAFRHVFQYSGRLFQGGAAHLPERHQLSFGQCRQKLNFFPGKGLGVTPGKSGTGRAPGLQPVVRISRTVRQDPAQGVAQAGNGGQKRRQIERMDLSG
jgi:hypothetical protein